VFKTYNTQCFVE